MSTELNKYFIFVQKGLSESLPEPYKSNIESSSLLDKRLTRFDLVRLVAHLFL